MCLKLWKGKDMKKAIGVDISKYDKTFNPDLSMYPLDFVFVRAGHSWNGIFYEDPRFVGYLPSVEKVPIRLAYCYLNSETTLNIQVDEFLDTIGKAPFEWDGFACDWEAAYNNVSSSFADKGVQWIKQIREATGLPVILYTNIDLYETYWVSRGKDLPLWLSWPLENNQWTIETIHNKEPNLPVGRDDWQLWQWTYTLKGTDWGLGRPDVGLGDMFNGNVADMRKFLEGEEGEIVPPKDKVLVNTALLEEVKLDSVEYKKVQKEFLVVSNKLQDAGDKLTANVNNLIKTIENPVPCDDEPEESDLWLTLTGLNIRSAPYVADNKTGSVIANTEVRVLKYDTKANGDMWGQIDTGWIALKYQGNIYARQIE